MNYEVVLAKYGVYCSSGFFCYDPGLFPRTKILTSSWLLFHCFVLVIFLYKQSVWQYAYTCVSSAAEWKSWFLNNQEEQIIIIIIERINYEKKV